MGAISPPSEAPTPPPAEPPADRCAPPAQRRVRRPRGLRLAAAALATALVGTGGVVGYLGSDHPAKARSGNLPSSAAASGGLRSPSVDSRSTREVAVAVLLDQRATAIERRDRAGFLATIDPTATQFARKQALMFGAIRNIPFERWSYELAAVSPFRLSPTRRQDLGPEAFSAKVVASYRLRDYDRAPAKLDLYYTFRTLHGRWVISSDTDGAGAGYRTQRGLWDFGPVTVIHGARSIILGLGGQRRLERYARDADRAVPRVSAVWGTDWERKVVVIAPETQAQMATLLGAPAGKYARIVAVTRAESAVPTAVRRTGLADRIVINPAIWVKLSYTGRRIVMTHEVTHVATRAATGSATPAWLSEGFADYLGYLGTGVPVDVAARELLSDVHATGPPRSLPADADFATDRTDLAAAYEQAWLACRLIAAKYGQERLVEFYHRAGTASTSDGDLGAVFADVLGTTKARFTASWRGYLGELGSL